MVGIDHGMVTQLVALSLKEFSSMQLTDMSSPPDIVVLNYRDKESPKSFVGYLQGFSDKITTMLKITALVSNRFPAV